MNERQLSVTVVSLIFRKMDNYSRLFVKSGVVALGFGVHPSQTTTCVLFGVQLAG